MAAVYTLKILTDFAAAHYLREYQGVCSRLHGHNWKVEVRVKARQLDKVGMAIDFKDIKAAARDLLRGLDHYNLNDLPPFDTVNPTAENLAAFLYRELAQRLNTSTVQVDAVTLWETDRACVTYTED
ncbi:MAG TPA: 6-carboxytetrahydropterin synthase QueD [Chromatiales bacterium]|nr:6-carboxytetrahydropterin synthase QueD [Chromatiales bacterium]